MDNDEYMPGQEEESILSIIQDIKDGTLNPKTVSKDIRQRCVEFLISEGYTEAQIAQIMMRSEKTISRDVADIQARNAITPDINLAKQIVGNMYQKAMVHHRYLMRLARSTETGPGDRAQSEFLAWRVLKEVIEKMQTLGYVPLKPHEIVGDIFHHVTDSDNERSIAEAKGMLAEIEHTAREAGTLDPETEDKIKAIKLKIEKAEISNDVDKLADKKDKPKEEDNKDEK